MTDETGVAAAVKMLLDRLSGEDRSHELEYDRGDGLSNLAVLHSKEFTVTDVEGRFGDNPPVAVKQKVVAHDAASFVEYVRRFATATSLVYANRAQRTIGCILDYHDHTTLGESPKPGRCQHTIVLDCPLSDRFAPWLDLHHLAATDDDYLPQNGMANFLVDHLSDVSDPPGAELLGLVNNFRATLQTEFVTEQVQETDEVTLVWNVQEDGKKGTLTLPTKIRLGVPVFEGQTPTNIDCQFRRRIVQGKLLLGVYIMEYQATMRLAFDAMVTTVAAQLSSADAPHAPPLFLTP